MENDKQGTDKLSDLGSVFGGGGGKDDDNDGGGEKKRSLKSAFEYDSDELEGHHRADKKKEEIRIRRPTKKDSFSMKVLDNDDAVKSTAKSIRHFRNIEGRVKGKEDQLGGSDEEGVATKIGGNYYEVTPNKHQKDVGAYPLTRTESGNHYQRSNADSYNKLAKELDDTGLTTKQLNSDVKHMLMGEGTEHADETQKKTLGMASTVLMTDMARGSRGPELVDDMLGEETDFKTRLGTTGTNATYKPARKAKESKDKNVGSMYIQNETKKRKLADKKDTDGGKDLPSDSKKDGDGGGDGGSTSVPVSNA